MALRTLTMFKEFNIHRKEFLSPFTRRAIYACLPTKDLLSKITRLSHRERRNLDGYFIQSGRHWRFELTAFNLYHKTAEQER